MSSAISSLQELSQTDGHASRLLLARRGESRESYLPIQPLFFAPDLTGDETVGNASSGILKASDSCT